jgi:phosphohistidine phosphatase
MDLIIVRHGIAEDLGGAVRRDADRHLTEEGLERTRQAAAGLRVAGCAPEAILTSPYARARETADVVAQALAPTGGVEIADVLAAGARPAEIIEGLSARAEDSILIVGHMPDLALLAAVLLAGAARVDIEFKKAAACCLVCEPHPLPGAAWLRWMLPPRLLRILGRADPD